MRAVVQRVASASVSVDGETVSAISKGLVVLLGIGTGTHILAILCLRGHKYDTTVRADDTAADTEYMANKILALRVFDADGVMWRQSVKDIAGDVLCVSQFTLLANTVKGSKPDFHRAMGSAPSKEMYAAFLARMGELYRPDNIMDGKFGAMMNVSLTNDGPVTFTLDSRKFEYVQPANNTTVKAANYTKRALGPVVTDQEKSSGDV